MIIKNIPLPKQLDMVFNQIKDELSNLDAGTIVIQIRNDVIGKFGVKHNPLTSKGGQFTDASKGLSASQVQSFRKMAIESLAFKKSWTHGEISFDFAVRNGVLDVSVQFESNYNMSTLL